MAPLTKDEWLARCAARYLERVQISKEDAADYATGSLESAMEREDGDEDRALATDPAKAADIDMSYWEEEGE